MTETKHCADCHTSRPLEAFYKTLAGAGRSNRCRDCIAQRVVAYRASQRMGQAEEAVELEAFLLANPNRLVPRHLAAAFKRLNQAPAKEPNARKLSNRPHMTCCEGCGETVPKRDLYEYRAGGRARYCKPCIRRRAVERECVDCGETKLTSEFFEGLRNVSPYCRACRNKREHEKHCPRCDVTKPVDGFNRSRGRPAGWCKQCSVNAQRERRAALRSQTA